MKITVQLFGVFKQLGERLTLSLPEEAIIADVRKALIEKMREETMPFNKKALMDSSLFATQTEILSETASLKPGSVIAIIPPVSGG